MRTIATQPCPLCKSTEISMSNLYELAYNDLLPSDEGERLSMEYCVKCTTCGSMTRPHKSEEGAIKDWEDRPGDIYYVLGEENERIQTVP